MRLFFLNRVVGWAGRVHRWKKKSLERRAKKTCDSTSVTAPGLVIRWALVHQKRNWCSHGSWVTQTGSSDTPLPVNEDLHAYSWFLSILRLWQFWNQRNCGEKKPRSCGMIQLKIGSLLKLSGKVRYFDIHNRNLKWEKEVNLWAPSYL